MKDEEKTRDQLVAQLAELRQRVADLEAGQTEHRRTEEALRRRNRELELINQVGQEFSSSLELDQVLVTVLEEVCRLLGVVASSVWLVDPETGELICRQAVGPRSEVVGGWRLAPGQGVAGWVARNAKSLIVSDARADKRYFRKVGKEIGIDLRSILSVPMRGTRDVIGVLQVVDTEVDRFDTADLRLLEAVGASAATAIENARLHEAVQRELAERKSVEKALRESEETYRTLVRASPDAVTATDLEGRITYVSERSIELHGCESAEELLGRDAFELIAPEDRERAAKNLERTREEGVLRSVQYVMERKDGSRFIGDLNAALVPDAAGNPRAFVATVRDISGRKRLEQQNEERRLYLESVLACAPDAIVTLDAQHRVREWNAGAERLFGHVREEALGRDIDDLVTGSDAGIYEQATGLTRRVLTGESIPPTEAIRYRKDGTVVDVILAGSPIFVRDELVGVVAVYTDITERRRSERVLREYHERFLTILDGIEADVYVADLETYEILYMNQHMRDSFGDDLVGRTCWEAFRDESAPCAHCTNDDLLDARGNPTGVHVWEGQNPVTHRWYVNHDRAIKWVDGRYVRLQVATDITDRVRAEEALRKSELQHRTLLEIANAVNSTLELTDILREVGVRAAHACEANRCTILLLDEEGETLRPTMSQFASGQSDPELWQLFKDASYPQRVEEVPEAQRVIRDHSPLFLPDARDSTVPRAWIEPFDVGSLLIVPLISREQVVGLMGLDRPETDFPFTPEQVNLAMTIASEAAIAIENSRLFQAEREQRELAEALEEAAAAVSSTLELDQVLDRILEEIERVVAGDTFNIMLIENDNARVVRHRGYEAIGAEERIAGFSVPVARYPCLLKMLRTREPVVVPDTASDPDWVQDDGYEWLRSYVAGPIQVAGMLVGFLNVDGTRPGQFGPDDTRRLKAFAHHAAAAIENARLYQQTSHRLAQTQVLREVMLAAASTLDFDQVLERTCETLQTAMDVEFVAVVLPDKDGAGLRPHPSLVGYPAAVHDMLLPMDGSVCGRVFQTGEPTIIGDVRDIPDYYQAAEEVRSQLAVPVRVGEEVIGVLTVESGTLAAFDLEDLAFYTAIAGQLGVALQNARLYEEVRRQADELTAAVARLEELDHLKSEFIQNVSHELRSPLALIRGYAEVLDGGVLGELRAEQQGPVSIIARRTRVLSDLVRDITLILEAEMSPPRTEPVALGELAEAVVEDFQIAIQQSGLTLNSEIARDLPAVSGSPTYLRRVLDNLIDNAVKFTPPGGTITVRAKRQGEQVALEVSDAGIGIPPDEQERIFERFYQVDGSAKRRYGGVGLGLALVKEIVEASGGTVEVESALGKGSTFTVTLPVFPG